MVELTQGYDVGLLTFYVFVVFFIGLVIHLQRESRREGFPLEDDVGNKDKTSWLFTPEPKTFNLPHGMGDIAVPNDKGDPNSENVKGRQVANFSGAPWQPTGDNPMLDGIGPGAWTERADVPDPMHDGTAKIVPMRVLKEASIATQDVDPRGLRVVGCDLIVAGRVKDVWVDRMEHAIRYYELETEIGEEPRTVLVPANMVTIKTPRDREKVLYVHAITGEQFTQVPTTKKKTEVTLLEEEKIMAYYGAGLLYATPARQEAWF
ncbi:MULTISPECIES: photosynthetic reaction center subunit H [unclassified Roseitalea]|uniref:photosynthetic reaction center subunit H n=1 Tax=unclassified Roseitalea TaxID=2639107 RepID=UPI00273E184A|nr:MULTISPECIES: photosynthetic reaction center subunit H [unclassified Roseitalea]